METALGSTELRSECALRGLRSEACVERADLEKLLKTSRLAPDLQEVRDELESFVAYGPRAIALLKRLDGASVSGFEQVLQRYVQHQDSTVAAAAKRLLEAPCRELSDDDSDSTARRPRVVKEKKKSRKEAACGISGRAVPNPFLEAAGAGKASIDIDDSSESSDDKPLAQLKGKQRGQHNVTWGWTREEKLSFHRRKPQFHEHFTLQAPFGNSTWEVHVKLMKPLGMVDPAKLEELNLPKKEMQRIQAEKSEAPKWTVKEVEELLERMALDLGALSPKPGVESASLGEQDRHVLQRLQRLEERFKGSGVTEGEARNAVRLFERELSKANWTEDKFAKLKRQLDGSEEWAVSDMVAESTLYWVKEGQRRQAWFANACERVATPLGVECGYTENGGSCFVGPLSSCAGAALTSVLVAHLATLDLENASRVRKHGKLSAPQFLSGFVDGALDKDRHLVWKKLFDIEDEKKAASFCEENLRQGFFDDSAEAADEGGADLQSMLRDMFATQSQRGRRVARPSGEVPTPPPAASYTPFSGKGHSLGEDTEERDQKGASPAKSWAITFASNLQLVRSVRRRSLEESRRTYHWSYGGRAIKDTTNTGSESYSKGKNAGEKRKGQIDSAAGTAKSKYQKTAKLALTR